MATAKELLESMVRRFNGNYWDLAEHMTNVYLTKYHRESKENKFILDMYATHIWFEIWAVVFRNNLHISYPKDQTIDYTVQDEIVKCNFSFKKELLKAKIDTYKRRETILRLWKKGKNITIKIDSQFFHEEVIEHLLLKNLLKLYPNKSNINEVIMELGLEKSLKELKDEYYGRTTNK